MKFSRGDIALEKNQGKLISKEELLALICRSPREKALIYLMALFGMAQDETGKITLRRFMDTAGESIKKEIITIFDLFDYEEELDKTIITFTITQKSQS